MFLNWAEEKYYDAYLATASVSLPTYYDQRILGDATGEMGPFEEATYGIRMSQVSSWYFDGAWFVFSAAPWLYRGGVYGSGTDAGVFSFGLGYGNVSTGIGYRIVLAI